MAAACGVMVGNIYLCQPRPLLLSMSMQFLTFGAFSAFWATLAFHLASPAFGLGPAAAGLFGLLGAPGSLLVLVAGRLSNRLGSSANASWPKPRFSFGAATLGKASPS